MIAWFFLAEDVTVIKIQEQQLLELMEEVGSYEQKDDVIAELEKQVDDLELYTPESPK